MDRDKRASIIIVTHNGIDYLEACLASLRRAVGPRDELIAVDNSSVDGSADLVRHHWPSATVIRNQTNLGFAAACNIGAEHAQGCYLVFLNQDTEVLPGWLDKLLTAFESDDAAAITTSRQQYLACRELLHCAGADLHYSGLIFLRGVLQHADESSSGTAKVQSVVGASFAVQRAVWEELGGFVPEFFMYYEEMDLSWRAQLAGYVCLYAPESVVYHDVAQAAMSSTKLYYICRNRQVSLLTNWQWYSLLLLTPGLFLAELAEFAFVTSAGRWQGILAKLVAYDWLFRNLGTVVRLRRDNRRLRRVPDWQILENRTWTLEPRQFAAGRSGQALAKLASLPLYANGWLAWRICRSLGW